MCGGGGGGGGWQQRVMAVGGAFEENLRFLVANQQQQPTFMGLYILPNKVFRI